MASFSVTLYRLTDTDPETPLLTLMLTLSLRERSSNTSSMGTLRKLSENLWSPSACISSGDERTAGADAFCAVVDVGAGGKGCGVVGAGTGWKAGCAATSPANESRGATGAASAAKMEGAATSIQTRNSNFVAIVR